MAMASAIIAAGGILSLSDGTHSHATTDADMAGNASVTSQHANVTAVASIMSFSAKLRTGFLIDGTSYEVHGAGQNWNLSSPDKRTLRFEIRPGDHAWFDNSTVDRSQVSSDQMIPSGTITSITYKFMLEPGTANTASWFVTAEMHNDDGTLGPNVHTSPPFAVELAGEHLRVVA